MKFLKEIKNALVLYGLVNRVISRLGWTFVFELACTLPLHSFISQLSFICCVLCPNSQTHFSPLPTSSQQQLFVWIWAAGDVTGTLCLWPFFHKQNQQKRMASSSSTPFCPNPNTIVCVGWSSSQMTFQSFFSAESIPNLLSFLLHFNQTHLSIHLQLRYMIFSHLEKKMCCVYFVL
jgi:hypothetical protein